MIRADRDLLARLGRLNQQLATFHVSMGEVVMRLLSTAQDGELDPGDLRMLGRVLVKLGGETTSLSVAMATRAIDIDQATGSADRGDHAGGYSACSL